VEIAGKPAPDLFLRACQELSLSPQEVIGFEDALSGIEALQKAGIFSIAIDRKTSLKLQHSGADLLVTDVSEVSIERLVDVFQRNT
jgi:beta-phosphoglucomutase